MKLERLMACKNRMILLLLDRCGAHSAVGLELSQLTVLYHPANTTSFLRSVDQGIIQSVKMNYRSRLTSYLIRQLEQKKERNKPGIGAIEQTSEEDTDGNVERWDYLQEHLQF
ncbi:hypothetical protein PR048_030283 [Dryococelus australis]|uniref:DDE-1 domain-containing protein n=1 Tax=Dryococelus australis TaxID=614101 RepID=A0ABQ9G911_9NEOP|nr:hypothetical protein PR048_030283 [Dryococelus australis]